MKQLHHASLAAIAALALSLTAACDSDGRGRGEPAPDTTDTGDVSTGSDTSTTPDTPVDDPTLIDPDIRCDRRDFDIQSQSLRAENGFAGYEARNAITEPTDLLSIELYSGGDFTGATGPGTYVLDDPNYATCSNCVLIRANCSAGTGCARTFYADIGTLNITRWDAGDGFFEGKLQGAVLREVTINTDTFESTPVPGGQTWCVADFDFRAEIKGLPTSDRTQPECVAAGTGNILGDNVRDFTLTNCNGDPVNLHDTCGQSKAMWLIATAGWCSACADFIGRLVENHGGSLSRAKVGQETPGLDMLIVLGEDTRRQGPSLSYCMQYATTHKLDPAMVVMDWSDAGVQIPLIDPEGYAIETNSLATTWSAINPYLAADASGGVASGYPWWALLDGRNMAYVWSDYAQNGTFERAVTDLLSAP